MPDVFPEQLGIDLTEVFNAQMVVYYRALPCDIANVMKNLSTMGTIAFEQPYVSEVALGLCPTTGHVSPWCRGY